MKESRKEFIKEGYKAACSEWKEKIEKEFPKLFKKDTLVVGKWYNGYENYLLYLTSVEQRDSYKKLNYYGFCSEWEKDYIANTEIENSLKPATDEEVEEALIKEAKNKGIWNVPVIDVYGRERLEAHFVVEFKHGCLWSKYGRVFYEGNWATPIETITKEQAEKELGKTILN
jgi:hypothetical protein